MVVEVKMNLFSGCMLNRHKLSNDVKLQIYFVKTRWNVNYVEIESRVINFEFQLKLIYEAFMVFTFACLIGFKCEIYVSDWLKDKKIPLVIVFMYMPWNKCYHTIRWVDVYR